MKREALYFQEEGTPFFEKLILIALTAPIIIKTAIKNFVDELRLGYYTEDGIKKMGRRGLRKILPHRGHALRIDQIIYNPEKSDQVVAIKKIRSYDPDLAGHFPGNPIYPGVLFVECAYLALASLVRFTISDVKGLPTAIGWDNQTRFRKRAVPEDVLRFFVILTKNHKNVRFIFDCKVLNQNDDVVAEMKDLVGMAAK